MTNISALTIAFLEKKPEAAARALLEMSMVDAASFLNTLPTRISAGVLMYVRESNASVLLAQMDPVNAAAVFRSQDYLWTTSTLRLIPTNRRKKIIAELPVKLKRQLEKSLIFPPDTIGAVMTSSLIIMRPDNSVADAKIELQRLPKALSELVFIIGDNRTLLGVVRTVTIFRHADKTKLEEAMETSISSLSARSRLNTVTDHTHWQKYNVLPVVSRRGQLIGALPRNALHIDNFASTTTVVDAPPLVVSLLEMSLRVSIGLGEVLLNSGKPSSAGVRRNRP